MIGVILDCLCQLCCGKRNKVDIVISHIDDLATNEYNEVMKYINNESKKYGGKYMSMLSFILQLINKIMTYIGKTFPCKPRCYSKCCDNECLTGFEPENIFVMLWFG